MIDIFSITNGRSTHFYSYKTLKECEGVEDITVIEDLKLKDALTSCIDTCKGDYFLKVDDDFFLHPKAFLYMIYCIEKKSFDNLGIYFFYLWEDFSNQIVQCIKIYSLQALKSIGGFKFDPSGKVDGATQNTLREKNFIIKEDSSILAIHSMGTKEEQKKYLNLWKSNAKNPNTYEKRNFNYMLNYNKSVEYQYSLREDFLLELNKKNNTGFWKWING